MKSSNKYLITLISLLFMFNCDDIIEEDITNKLITVITPVEGSVNIGDTVNFQWNELDGADDYRIQISNTQNQLIIVDSLITNNNFVYNLSPGNYQWRIRGENFAYESVYTFPVNFSVEISEDLTNQSVVLLTPNADYYVNNSNIIFTWESLSSATSYSFELDKIISGQQTIYIENGITATNFSPDSAIFDEDAEYIWKIKAVNGTSESSFSERSLYLDTVIPSQPTLTIPNNDETLAVGSVDFNWTNGADSGTVQSPIANTFEISIDSNFNTILNSQSTENNTVQYEFTNTGTYYWRVKAVDEATNESDYSIVRTLIIQ